MACITHTVMSCELGCTIDLQRVASCSRDVVYKKVPVDALSWHHKKIRCTCFLYRTGKMICHGNKSQLRQYARIMQKMGYPVCSKCAERLKKNLNSHMSSSMSNVCLADIVAQYS